MCVCCVRVSPFSQRTNTQLHFFSILSVCCGSFGLRGGVGHGREVFVICTPPPHYLTLLQFFDHAATDLFSLLFVSSVLAYFVHTVPLFLQLQLPPPPPPFYDPGNATIISLSHQKSTVIRGNTKYFPSTLTEIRNPKNTKKALRECGLWYGSRKERKGKRLFEWWKTSPDNLSKCRLTCRCLNQYSRLWIPIARYKLWRMLTGNKINVLLH